MEKIIEIHQLSKSFGSVRAVDNISLYVEKGALFAFLGPNGAGKSTTIEMITTQLQPDSGEIKVNGCTIGRDDDAIRSSIGIVYQDSLLDPLLTVEESLLLRGGLYRKSRTEQKAGYARAVRAAGAEELAKRRYGKLSGGQRRRVDIARALIHSPKVLILDEPTTGLDPQTRRHIWAMIRKLQQEEQLTVFLTTHYMEEAAQADYVVVMDRGAIRAQGTPQRLREDYAPDVLRLRPLDADKLIQALRQAGREYSMQGEVFYLFLSHTTEALPLLEQYKDNIANVEIISGTLEDVFIQLTGSELRNG